MAKKALIEKQQRTPKFKVRGYTRCRRCGRPKSVYRKFGLCRICLRVMVHAGEIPGVTKLENPDPNEVAKTELKLGLLLGTGVPDIVTRGGT